MTNSSRKILLAIGMACMPALVFAQTQPVKPATPPPAAKARPVIINTPTRNQQFQQQVNQQQIQNSQRQSNLQQQIRQNNVDTQRANVTEPAMSQQLQNTEAARRQQQQQLQQQNTQVQPAAPARASTR